MSYEVENYVVWNQSRRALENFNFMLRVELLFDIPLRSVKPFTRELEYEHVQEGGLNDYVHMRRKAITKPFTLEIERYVTGAAIDPLPLGTPLVLPLMLMVGHAPNQFIPLWCARTYVFTGCVVISKTFGELISEKSGLLTENLTISYQEMYHVDNPLYDVAGNIGAE